MEVQKFTYRPCRISSAHSNRGNDICTEKGGCGMIGKHHIYPCAKLKKNFANFLKFSESCQFFLYGTQFFWARLNPGRV